MILSAILGLMYLVTDCDKTLVHYDNPVNDEGGTTDALLFQLPASSGSGRIGYVSSRTLDILDEISQHTPIICASGMRVSTMLQRQPFFSSVKYWLCENGGRIFEKVDDNNIIELPEWQTQLNQDGAVEDRIALNRLATELQQNGWLVDQNGYETMFRVRIGELDPNSKSLQSLINRISTKHLKYTFNLDYIDIYIKGSGKLASVQWLTSYLTTNGKERSHQVWEASAETNTVTSISSSSRSNDINSDNHPIPPHTTTTSNSKNGGFVFMGDDTNDIEIASQSTAAFIVMPCSDDMQNWIHIQADIARDIKEEESAMLDWLNTQNEQDIQQHQQQQQRRQKVTYTTTTTTTTAFASSIEEQESFGEYNDQVEVELEPLDRPVRITKRLYTAPVNGFRGTEANLFHINKSLLKRFKSQQ